MSVFLYFNHNRVNVAQMHNLCFMLLFYSKRQGRLVATINGDASENYPISLIFVTISQLYTHTHTHSLPVVRQKENLITQAHKGRSCMSDSFLSTAALQSTANFKHHITGALKQKDFHVFFINLEWLLRSISCIIQCNYKYKKNKEKRRLIIYIDCHR